jgi:hypothetical protein
VRLRHEKKEENMKHSEIEKNEARETLSKMLKPGDTVYLMKNLFDQVKDSGIPYDHHESDLYVLVTPESQKILVECLGPRPNGICTFTSQIDGKLWYDVPFAYRPFWEAKL